MTIKSRLSGLPRGLPALFAVVLTVCALYFGREILIPLAMAVLLTFLLTPLVEALERRKLSRVPAVLVAILGVFVVAAVASWVIGSQLNDLANRLPTYQENLKVKLESLRASGGAIEKVESTLSDAGKKLEDQQEAAQPVRVVAAHTKPLDRLEGMFSTVMAPIASAGIVLVLVIFMLINREDLRNRLVRLCGARLALTTRALDDVGSRISRYLLLNAMVNGGFGVAIAIGLTLIGVEYAIMWGFLAGVLRFVPYVGTMLAASMPIGMAFIQFPGHDWLHPVLAASLFIVIELILMNVVEPLAYGTSTGVSTVALLVAAMFWTWIWGPLGLVLAVPLTVVMAVLGEHVAALEPLSIILSDKPPLAAYINFYQRLLAKDTDEGFEILAAEAKTSSPIAAFDSVVIPALILAEKDQIADELPEAEQQAMWQTTREYMDELVPENAAIDDLPRLSVRAIGCPAHDLADEIALLMLKRTMKTGVGGQFEILPVTMLVAEMVARVEQERPDVVCISSLGAPGVPHARHLCLRLSQALPKLRIVVARWGSDGDREKIIGSFKKRGTDQVVFSLGEGRDYLAKLMPLVQSDDKPSLAVA